MTCARAEPAPPVPRAVQGRQAGDANFTPASIFSTGFNPFGPSTVRGPPTGFPPATDLPTLTSALTYPPLLPPTTSSNSGSTTSPPPQTTPRPVSTNAAPMPTGGVFAAYVGLVGAVLAL